MKTKKEIKAYIKKVEEEYQRTQSSGGQISATSRNRVHEANIQNASVLWALNWVLAEEESK